MLGIKGNYPAGHPYNILTNTLENCKISLLKHFTEKYTLINFENLYIKFCLRLPGKTNFKTLLKFWHGEVTIPFINLVAIYIWI